MYRKTKKQKATKFIKSDNFVVIHICWKVNFQYFQLWAGLVLTELSALPELIANKHIQQWAGFVLTELSALPELIAYKHIQQWAGFVLTELSASPELIAYKDIHRWQIRPSSHICNQKKYPPTQQPPNQPTKIFELKPTICYQQPSRQSQSI